MFFFGQVLEVDQGHMSLPLVLLRTGLLLGDRVIKSVNRKYLNNSDFLNSNALAEVSLMYFVFLSSLPFLYQILNCAPNIGGYWWPKRAE